MVQLLDLEFSYNISKQQIARNFLYMVHIQMFQTYLELENNRRLNIHELHHQEHSNHFLNQYKCHFCKQHSLQQQVQQQLLQQVQVQQLGQLYSINKQQITRKLIHKVHILMFQSNLENLSNPRINIHEVQYQEHSSHFQNQYKYHFCK
jgi:hypothetical protein